MELHEIKDTLNYIRLIHQPMHTPQDLHEIELMYCLAGESDALQAVKEDTKEQFW